MSTFNKSCKKCLLCKTRNNVVCGVGTDDARVMLVGEAPGKNEDEQGIPFVGAAGKQLDELLSCAGLKRDEVYITNLVKCRPPKNRNPYVAEVKSCSEYLLGEIACVRPSVIVSLGNYPTRFLLGTKEGITALHGKPVSAKISNLSVVVFPVFHPAAAIYDRRKIEILKSDLKRLAKIL